MKNLLVLIFAATISLLSCYGTTDDALSLNDGEKWEVEPNMMEYIRSMEEDLMTFDTDVNNNYTLLGEKLDDNLALLTQNCTMKGEAHDQLHKWLVPYMQLVNEFNESTTDEEAKTSLDKLIKSFIIFNHYFK